VDPTQSNEPYCSHCGYNLTGLVDSSKCPECGRPLVDVLARRSMLPTGKRYQSKTRIFGWPLISIAMGPGPEGMRGVARGIVAIGDIAIGGLAFGGMAIGVIAIGGMALGLTAIGGLGIGLLAAMGGGAIGGLAFGGGALGVIAQGGLAIGVIADGGTNGRGGNGVPHLGYIVRDAPVGQANPFVEWHWLLGSSPGHMTLAFWILGLILILAAISALILLAGWLATGREDA
jgi:hypothetical protein